MDQQGSIELSLIIPVYNCEKWIQGKLEEICYHLRGKNFPWELIVVDDCSQEETPQKVNKFLEKIPNTVFIAHSENHGKGGAVLSGLRAAKGKYRIFTDCDLTYPLTEVDKILELLKKGADVAIGNRRDPDSICELKPAMFRQVYSRELFGRCLNAFIRFFGLTDFYDTQAGLKGMRDWLVPYLDRMQVFRFGFDVELLLIAKIQQAKIEPVSVRYQFFEGVSTVKIFLDGSKILKDLYRIGLLQAKGYYSSRKINI